MNKINRFLDDVCSHVRCNAIRNDVRNELLAHIEDLYDEYTSQGLSPQDAERKAVAAMGDSTKIGEALNARHRPRTDFLLIIMTIVAAILGVVGIYFYRSPKHGVWFEKQMIFAVCGIAVLLFTYLFDYTKLEKFALPIYFISLAAALLTATYGVRFNGARIFLMLGAITIRADFAVLLNCISIAGITMKQKGKGLYGVAVTGIFSAAACIPFLIMPCFRLFCEGLVCCIVIISAAILRGHFGGNRKIQLTALFTPVIILMIIVLAANPHIISRLTSAKSDIGGSGYPMYIANQWLENSAWFGAAQRVNGFDVTNTLVSSASEYVLVSFIATFGRAAGIMVLALIAALIARMVITSLRIRNSFGFYLASGASAALTIQFVSGILITFGLLPFSSALIPFISYGGSSCIINMALMGLILSAWRRDNLIPCEINNITAKRRLYISDGKLIFDMNKQL